jgi:EPS-associated MarR family transcriptional regulator
MINDEVKYHLLKLLEKDPNMSQRAISKEMGISLGKVNYCLHALIDKGIIKAKNFYKNKNKTAYTYFLTPKGIEEKGRITYRFLQAKLSEYEQLKAEIEEIRKEASSLGSES